MMEKRGLGDAALRGRRVLVRVDYNVPQDESGHIADDRRIQESLPTLNHLRTQGARTILMSHLGRPGGTRDPRYSLKPVARRLSSILGQPVPIAEDIVGIQALELSSRIENGGFLMLENLRFNPGEEANDPAFAAQLARLGDLFVEDAFGAVHRAHASTVGVPKRIPAVAGLLVEREIRELSRLLVGPARPYVVVLGGAKVSDKLPLLESFCGRADSLLLGGALVYPFLVADGARLGATKVETGLEAEVAKLRKSAAERGTEIVLPTDVVVERPGAPAPEVCTLDTIPDVGIARDIGPSTRTKFRELLERSKTVFWNGPLGLAEDPRFAGGTKDVLGALSSVAGFHVAAGGDSARTAGELGVLNGFEFVSTGGGAALEFVQGLELPGLAVLPNA
jgi:3-phosphoglycerate kinase